MEFVTSRIFEEPIQKVFRAWIEPEHLKEWWGPKDFRNTFHQCDIRPNGEWIFTMHAPNGATFENKMRFVEVEPESKIVLQHESSPRFQLTALFSEEDNNRTKIEWRQKFETEREYDAVKTFVPEANEQNLDRLSARLKQIAD